MRGRPGPAHPGRSGETSARAMYPGYTGFRPRIQLWHGSADTIINYANYTEAVEQWTNVLGLPATPIDDGDRVDRRQELQSQAVERLLRDHGPRRIRSAQRAARSGREHERHSTRCRSSISTRRRSRRPIRRRRVAVPRAPAARVVAPAPADAADRRRRRNDRRGGKRRHDRRAPAPRAAAGRGGTTGSGGSVTAVRPAPRAAGGDGSSGAAGSNGTTGTAGTGIVTGTGGDGSSGAAGDTGQRRGWHHGRGRGHQPDRRGGRHGERIGRHHRPDACRMPGCACEVARGPGATNALALAGILAAVFLRRRRAKKRSASDAMRLAAEQ